MSAGAVSHPLIRRLEKGVPQTIGFYGTSLTAEGAWVPQVLAALRARFPGLVTSFNGAGSGMHSGWGVENVEDRVIARAPSVVFIEFAVNDAAERFGITPAQARQNLETIIARIRRTLPAGDIILQVMNPVIDRPEGHAGWRPRLQTYQDNYREAGRAHGFLVIDHMPAWTALLETDERQFRAWVPDGLHPAPEGYAALVTPAILAVLG